MRYKLPLLPVIACCIILAASCTKDIDPGEPHYIYAEKTLKRHIFSWYVVKTGGGHHKSGGDTTILNADTSYYEYNNQGKLIKADTITFHYNSDGRLTLTTLGFDTVRYHYAEGRLSILTTNCGYYDGGRYTDTTRFYYDNQGRVQYHTSTYAKSYEELVYSNNNRPSARYISRQTPVLVLKDSLFYDWNNSNLTSITSRAGYPNNQVQYRREFRYDNRPSYVASTKFPKEYLLMREITQFYGKSSPLLYYDLIPWRYNCANNPVELTEINSVDVSIKIAKIRYDINGYPEYVLGDNFMIWLEYY